MNEYECTTCINTEKADGKRAGREGAESGQRVTRENASEVNKERGVWRDAAPALTAVAVVVVVVVAPLRQLLLLLLPLLFFFAYFLFTVAWLLCVCV